MFEAHKRESKSVKSSQKCYFLLLKKLNNLANVCIRDAFCGHNICKNFKKELWFNVCKIGKKRKEGCQIQTVNNPLQ